MFRSIEKFKELYSTRTDPKFWADNIVESSRLCKDDQETKHFYAYIINPNGYKYAHVESSEYRTLGDVTNDTDITHEPYPAHMETQVFKNGNEYTIYNKNTQNPTPLHSVEEEHDEKSPV